MSKQHSYTNPSEKVDTSAVESDSSGHVDANGFSVRPPISDRECIYKCLDNNRQMAGLDRKQVARLCEQFAVEMTEEQIKNEYPPL
jgi:hypothetical protein|tara:strand:+ start:1537 stop:1794 length:258 start_codon:yes stop_codon:yes gene_type:complete